MKIFITGATGFIGKNLVERLIKENYQITINLWGDEVSPFNEIVSTYKLNENNIQKDIDFFKRQGFDGIIHLASLYLTVHKPEQVTQLIDSNVKFGSYILECAVNSEVKWFINTGTFWQHYENSNYSPVNLYAATKQAFESIAQYYVETNQIWFCTLKLSDTFGPNDTRPKIFSIWDRISKTGETLDMSPGEQIIDISYIDDIVDAFNMLTKHMQHRHSKIKNGDVFAVKAEKLFTLKELAEIFQSVVQRKLNINWGARSYREREVMIPWNKGKVVPGWKQKDSIIKNIVKCYM